MPAFEAVPGMPYWQDLVTNEPQKSAYFYTKVLGWEVSAGDYRVARMHGLPVAGIVSTGAKEALNEWVPYFLSVDVAADAKRVEKLGGRVLATAEVDLGTLTVCADPFDGYFGLIQPAGEDRFVAAGEPGVPVWYNYGGPEVAAVDFYAELFDWEVQKVGDEYIALQDGAPFLSMEIGLVPELALWQVYFGVEDLSAAVNAAEMFGAKYLTEPELTSFGLVSYQEDATGAGVYFCEVEMPVFEEASESDSILHLDPEA